MQLLAPAHDALLDPCLTGPITEYDWVEGIVLMTIFVLFFVELMTMRYAKFGHSHSHDDLEPQDDLGIKPEPFTDAKKPETHDHDEADPAYEMHPGRASTSTAHCPTTPHARGDDHLGHARSHVDNELSAGWTEAQKQAAGIVTESYAAQMTALFILEFGVIFHSIFIGLTLAVSGDEFTTLYVVLVFHQSFEGLGLGTRLAAVPWPESKRWSPYLLGLAYGVSTPIAIAVGLGVRQSFAPGSQTTLIANGVFDSISAGILIYTQRASIKTVLTAFFVMCLGAGLMALLGKWA
jgi:zinc transporter 1/2/3